jgi:hypothetical protein
LIDLIGSELVDMERESMELSLDALTALSQTISQINKEAGTSRFVETYSSIFLNPPKFQYDSVCHHLPLIRFVE